MRHSILWPALTAAILLPACRDTAPPPPEKTGADAGGTLPPGDSGVAGAPEPANAMEAEIGELLAAYAAAINSRDEARLRELYPSISTAGIADMGRLPSGDSVRITPLAGTLVPGKIENTQEIQVRAEAMSRGGTGVARPMIYTVARGAQGWHIVSTRPGAQP
ncbi:MAG: hypothetical protein FIB01_16145 [Gemmatimonadetes bacterium]|nr:hypothetical protein [Gemmatimonadota bacterium]